MRSITTITTFAVIGMLTACSAEDRTSVVGVAQSDTRLSTLEALVRDAGLADTLSSQGPFTILAPTNAAFDKLAPEMRQTLSQDRDALAEILSNHVIEGRLDLVDIAAAGEATTLAGGSVSFAVRGASIVIEDAMGNVAAIVESDVEASNGIVHVIDDVLMPGEDSEPELLTIAELAGEAGLTTLVDAVVLAGLAPALSSPGSYTVFAPTNAAFVQASPFIPDDPGLLANVLLHHVLVGARDAASVTTEGPFATLAKTQLTVDPNATPITINGFALSETLDVQASNGIVHVMDEVIIPPTILEFVADAPELSTLVTAVGAASPVIGEALASGPITVFAPINSAFAELDPAALEALLADQPALDRVLGYHVATTQLLASDLIEGQQIQMASGDSLTVEFVESQPTLVDSSGNQIRIAQTDGRLLNGTVHYIEGVLMPDVPLGNIVEVAADAGGFETLLGAALAIGLDAALTSPGPFTLFAPTNAAFENLGVDLTPVRANVIENILLYHVVAGRNDSAAVLASPALHSLANLPLAVDEHNLTIGGAALSTTLDVEASNGIIHAMDQVIVPPTIAELVGREPYLTSLAVAIGRASGGVQAAVAPNTLNGDSPITVFAPNDAAFAAAGIDLGNIHPTILDPILAHHVVGSQKLSSDLTDGRVVTTLNGTITVSVDANGRISLTDGSGSIANVIATRADARTLTGVVHVIDRVLQPAEH